MFKLYINMFPRDYMLFHSLATGLINCTFMVVSGKLSAVASSQRRGLET